jgi:hypothetical protein
MAIYDSIETMLASKVDVVMKKYNEARKKFVNKQMELVKKYEPDFNGTIDEFFRNHTIVSDSTYHQKKHYDITTHKWVNYDVVDSNIGVIYDEVGKQVYWQSKKTIEYIVYEYYSKIIFSMMNFLDRSNHYGDISVESTYTVEQSTNDEVLRPKK